MAECIVSGTHRGNGVGKNLKAHSNSLYHCGICSFFVGIASMFLLSFLVEGQSPIMRGVWMVLGIGMLVYYLRLMKTVVVQMRTPR